jgi:multiple sugar transport system permease protein
LKKRNQIITYVLLFILSGVVAFPFLWLIATSLKTYPQIYKFPIEYLPSPITFEHYYDVLLKHDFLRYFKNSAIYSVGTGVLSVCLAVMPAYAFSRFRFPGKKGLLISIIICQMFPQIVFVIPFFILLKSLSLINSSLGIILVYLPFTTPVAVWMAINFFNKIPIELEEAAMLDGCNRFQTFFRIALPLTIPGLAAVAIYSFLFSWGELMFSMSFLPDQGKQTLPILLSLFVGQYNTRWGQMFAGSVVTTIPALLMFMFLQKYFIGGMTAGAVKG